MLIANDTIDNDAPRSICLPFAICDSELRIPYSLFLISYALVLIPDSGGAFAQAQAQAVRVEKSSQLEFVLIPSVCGESGLRPNPNPLEPRNYKPGAAAARGLCDCDCDSDWDWESAIRATQMKSAANYCRSARVRGEVWAEVTGGDT